MSDDMKGLDASATEKSVPPALTPEDIEAMDDEAFKKFMDSGGIQEGRPKAEAEPEPPQIEAAPGEPKGTPPAAVSEPEPTSPAAPAKAETVEELRARLEESERRAERYLANIKGVQQEIERIRSAAPPVAAPPPPAPPAPVYRDDADALAAIRKEALEAYNKSGTFNPETGEDTRDVVGFQMFLADKIAEHKFARRIENIQRQGDEERLERVARWRREGDRDGAARQDRRV